MVLYHFVLCCSWLILSWIVSKGGAEKRSYMTYDMNIICKQFPNFKIRMHHTNSGSTGVLTASDYLSEEEETECVAKITPPRGYGVIYHFERLELRKDANNDCRDYIKISNETSRSSNASQPVCRDCCRFSRTAPRCGGHCGYESDGLVCEEFCDRDNATAFPMSGSSSRSLAVHFHTRCGTCTHRREPVGFKMVFTAFKLNTDDMNIICKQFPNFKIRMHHTNSGSTGVLTASDYLSEEEETECVAKITPPRGYGVIYHFERLELRKDANNDCRDYIKISNETSRSSNASQPVCRDCCRFSRTAPRCGGHCGYESDGLVCEEFCDRDNATAFPMSGSSARSLAVHFHTRCGTCTHRREPVGFKMVFTAFKLNTVPGASCGLSTEFQCDNGRCIWSGLTCDNYNNCGDMSDENSTGNSRCAAEFPDPMKAVIVASAVIVTVFLGVVLAYLPKMSLHALLGRNKRTQPTFHHHQKKPSVAPLIVPKKTSNTKSVSFKTPLPKIREVDHNSIDDESQV